MGFEKTGEPAKADGTFKMEKQEDAKKPTIKKPGKSEPEKKETDE